MTGGAPARLGYVVVGVLGLVAMLGVLVCVHTPHGRRLHPLAGDGIELIGCLSAQAACVASGRDCAALAAAGCDALRTLVPALEARPDGSNALWWCVAYDRADVEDPSACVALPRGRCGVCWDDPREAWAAAMDAQGRAPRSPWEREPTRYAKEVGGWYDGNNWCMKLGVCTTLSCAEEAGRWYDGCNWCTELSAGGTSICTTRACPEVPRQ